MNELNQGGRCNFVDITGQKFGILTAIGRTERTYRAPNGRIERRWILRCECGAEVTRRKASLKKSKTCGAPKCRNPWVSNVFKEKREAKGEIAKLSSWQKMARELKQLRIENAKILLELSRRQ